MSEAAITTEDIPEQFRGSLRTDESLESIAETEDGVVVATDERLLIEQDIDIGSIEYEDMTSVEAVTLRDRNRKFYAGITLLVLSIPGLIQGSTGTLLFLFPLAAILLLWWYKGNKVVEIQTTTREEPFHLHFKDIEEAATHINDLRKQ